MRVVTHVLALMVLGGFALGSARSEDLVRLSSVPIASDKKPYDAALWDLDGDGLSDLVVAWGDRTGTGLRQIAWFRRLGPGKGFPEQPTQSFDLPKDILAFAMADVNPAPGQEILLLTQGGAYALLLAADEANRFQRLLELDCLWQLPDDNSLPYWPRAVADLDGDGLQDLLIPSLHGYVCAMQRRPEASEGLKELAKFEAHALPLLARLSVDKEKNGPLQVKSTSSETSLELNLNNAFGVSTLVEVSDEVPAPFLLDADGDGRRELLVQDETQLQWFAGGSQGPQGPAESHPSPVIVDARRALDVSFASLLADIDGDGRLDWVLVVGDQRASKPRTQVLVHLQKIPSSEAPERFQSTPDQVLVLDGFAGDTRLYDLNGDGLLDLSRVALRPDLLQAIAQSSSDRYELEQYIYLNEGGQLSRRPILAEKLSFQTEESFPSMEFVRDRTGDKVADFFWRPEAGKLRLSMVNTRGERWALMSKPLWDLGIDPKARLLVDSIRGAGAMASPLQHALVLGDKDISVVEF
jgi:hypothetical protein